MATSFRPKRFPMPPEDYTLDVRIRHIEDALTALGGSGVNFNTQANSTLGNNAAASAGQVSGGGGGGGVNPLLGGDVTGPAVNNTVSKLQGQKLTLSSASTNQVLTWDGTQWINGPAAVILAPDSTTRNTIQPTADTNPGLTVKGHSDTQSAVLAQFFTGPTSFAANSGTIIFANQSMVVECTDPTTQPFQVKVAANTALTDVVDVWLNRDAGGAVLNEWKLKTTGTMHWNAKTTTTFRNQAYIVPSWFDNTDATHKGQLSLQTDGFVSGPIEGLQISNDGTNASIGFLGKAAIVRAAAYTLSGSATRVFPTDPSVAFTGINNAQAGTPYAQVTDLNTLRVAVSTLIGIVRQGWTDLGSSSGFGLLNA